MLDPFVCFVDLDLFKSPTGLLELLDAAEDESVLGRLIVDVDSLCPATIISVLLLTACLFDGDDMVLPCGNVVCFPETRDFEPVLLLLR